MKTSVNVRVRVRVRIQEIESVFLLRIILSSSLLVMANGMVSFSVPCQVIFCQFSVPFCFFLRPRIQAQVRARTRARVRAQVKVVTYPPAVWRPL